MSQEKLNVLFVDDDVKILDGLRRQLRSRRQSWEMRFAGSGAEALELLAVQPVDVIVSDMRMPGMSGGQLLKRVRDSYPQTTRIILSGQTDQADLYCELGCIHQYLQKPCDGDMLCHSIERTQSLARLLSQPALRLVANRVTALPPASQTYRTLVDELAKPDASIAKVAKTIAGDPALAAKVMQLVNSAFFGMPRRVASPDAASVLLGINTIHGIVVAGRIFDFVSQSSDNQAAIASLWESSIQIGESAGRFAKRNGASEAATSKARLAGLLSLIGRVILLTSTPDNFKEVMARSIEKSSTFSECESVIYGATQDEVSAYCLGLWAFPEEVIEAVLLQNHPSIGLNANPNEVVGYLHLARATHQPTSALGVDEAVAPDYEFLESAGLMSLIPEQARMAA